MILYRDDWSKNVKMTKNELGFMRWPKLQWLKQEVPMAAADVMWSACSPTNCGKPSAAFAFKWTRTVMAISY